MEVSRGGGSSGDASGLNRDVIRSLVVEAHGPPSASDCRTLQRHYNKDPKERQHGDQPDPPA